MLKNEGPSDSPENTSGYETPIAVRTFDDPSISRFSATNIINKEDSTGYTQMVGGPIDSPGNTSGYETPIAVRTFVDPGHPLVRVSNIVAKEDSTAEKQVHADTSSKMYEVSKIETFAPTHADYCPCNGDWNMCCDNRDNYDMDSDDDYAEYR
jgi:hypothetical protein